jgi:two-component system, sensor histidine kinase and response regulator
MKQILVIEDDLQILNNIQEILLLEDFDVLIAQNGAIGVQLAKTRQPDLVICDVMMPELDGFSVLKTLRQNSLTATIPIIFLTAKAARNDMRVGMELGADDYLTKPFTVQELLKAISTRLEKQEIIKQENAAKLDSLRWNIASFIPHELLTPLHGILGVSDLLLNCYETMSVSEVVDSIRVIQVSGTRLNRLVRNFMLYTELEANAINKPKWKDQLECTDVKYIIGLAARRYAKELNREQDLEIDVEDATVNISGKYFTKVVEELVENAFKFSESGTPVRLFSEVDSQFFKLCISDRGRGMTIEQIANIGAYMQFERKHYEQQGNGLGLILAKRIVELYGGEFSVESIVSEQTTICIKLPQFYHQSVII